MVRTAAAARLGRSASRAALCALALSAMAGMSRAQGAAAAPDPPFPLDEFLTYDIRYLGVHCGAMTLTSYADRDSGTAVYRIAVAARTSKFFDGVYRVRVRIDSEYSAERGSSLSYHQYGEEKHERKDELWQVDFDAREVRRTRGGALKTFPLTSEHVVDPLAFIYRMRLLLSNVGQRATLAMMTSHGAVDAVAEAVEKRTVKTPFGTREVLVVVPHPEQDELFTKKGTMEIWVGADEQRLPYRVVFDLPFGKLVARLEKIESRANGQDLLAADHD
jgi:hypothetical protein